MDLPEGSTSARTVVRLAITPGEPAGIGPDVAIRVAQRELDCQLVCIADPELLQERAQVLNLPLSLQEFDAGTEPKSHIQGSLLVDPISTSSKAVPGQLNSANASYVVDTLRRASEGCLSRRFDGIVTGPVQKSIINDAGIPFSGHTEFFADLANTQKVVMMLATRSLRVALVTTHLPLSAVPRAITAENLEQTIRIIEYSLKRDFACPEPRILVCGLNPHAGEGGHLGREEIEVIEPVLEKLRSEGFKLTGPLPADTAFTADSLSNGDVVLAMYHDQGLPVLKSQGFGDAVNITLGLPFIRTSVDHGTALSLAGTGQASDSSLFSAIQIATDMARSSSRQHP